MNEVLRIRTNWFGKPRRLEIVGDSLIVSRDASCGSPPGATETIPLCEIVELRLSHYPARFETNRYRCRLTTAGGVSLTFINVFYQGPLSERDYSAEYRAFALELCRRVAGANPAARFVRGRPRVSMLVENGVLLVLFVVMLGVFAWLRPALHWFQVIQILLIVVYFPLALISYRKNREGIFDPYQAPEEVLPK